MSEKCLSAEEIGEIIGNVFSDYIITKMKERMLNNPAIMKEIKKLMADGISRDEALDILICAWLSSE